MMGITGAFSSLGINERSHTPDKKISKNVSTISLPNLASSERHTISPNCIRNVSDEIETSEQPIDFSKKYCETKVIKNDFNNVVTNYNTSFTIYAETDLDQPTDYSLRYAEDDSDSDQCNKLPKSEAVEFVQDTIKTYCTEDTPYETPFNFSTSTSMSDLRIDDKGAAKLDPDTKSTEITVMDTKSMSSTRKIKSEFSSGLMSPEKPVNYCEEGTPGYFSRVASCGSLNSLSVNDPPKQLKENLESEKKELRRVGKFPTETKAVKFEEVVNYAEETPLMFSRSSSLASLDSIEQHSIHDDRSSVVSDFSRLTSGVISPSELPDSPSQTVPPSPKPRKNPIVFPPILKKKTDEITTVEVPKSSVFEDAVKKFKMESTPLEFSTATSLSSLIGDEVEPHKPTKPNDLDNELSENSDDEDILAACINIGMQNNRYSQLTSNSPPVSEAPSYKFNQQSDIIALNIPKNSPVIKEPKQIQKSDVTSDCVRTYCTEDTPAVLSHAGSNSNLSALSMHGNEETNEIECTTGNSEPYNSEIATIRNNQEEAPAEAEPNGDHNSRRSSFSSLSDDSHESEQALLQKCILAGMPSKSDASPVYSDGRKSEIVSDAEEDANVLANCINLGMNSNRYSQETTNNKPTFKVPPPPCGRSNNDIADTVKSYCTEDTPAVLSNAGSCSNLSILSTQEENYLSDLNSNFSDEDDERLLEECVKYGMAAISGKIKFNTSHAKKGNQIQDKKDLGYPQQHDDTSSVLYLSDGSEDDLLEQCIQAGMPQKSKDDSNDLTPTEKALLQQCILEGMKKCRAPPKKNIEEDTSELTKAEQVLLRQCILSGMPKNKNLTQGGPSGSRETTELTETERLLLQQCIVAGMPKRGSKFGGRRSKEVEKNEGEHTCCIHCPRNNSNRGVVRNVHVKTKRRFRERGAIQVREGRDVNILYVTGQILTLKKEIIDGSHEKWV